MAVKIENIRLMKQYFEGVMSRANIVTLLVHQVHL